MKKEDEEAEAKNDRKDGVKEDGKEEEENGLEPIDYELYDLEQALKCKDKANEMFKKV